MGAIPWIPFYVRIPCKIPDLFRKQACGGPEPQPQPRPQPKPSGTGTTVTIPDFTIEEITFKRFYTGFSKSAAATTSPTVAISVLLVGAISTLICIF